MADGCTSATVEGEVPYQKPFRKQLLNMDML